MNPIDNRAAMTRRHAAGSPSSPLRRQLIRGAAALVGASMVGALPACNGESDALGATPDAGRASVPAGAAARTAYAMPGEDAPHAATYMAFASGAAGIWTRVTAGGTNAGISRVRADLMDVAKAVGTYEPVNMLVLPADLAVARKLLDTPSGANPGIHAGYVRRPAGTGGVRLVPVANGFDDFWTRDTGCVFVKDARNGNALCAVDFNFNGWGNANTDGVIVEDGGIWRVPDIPAAVRAASNRSKAGVFYQPFAHDNKLAAWMANAHRAPLIRSTLTLEGGALEVDGEGTAIVTESSVLHVNRNPQLFSVPDGDVSRAKLLPTARETVRAELQRTLGIDKVIWLPGTAIYPRRCGAGASPGAATPEAETDITNGHADFYAKFLAPGVVAYASDPANATGERALMLDNLKHLSGQTDARGRALQLVELAAPAEYGESDGVVLNRSQMANFAAGYINFYQCNGAFIVPKFNDAAADQAAVNALRPYAGSRAIVQVDILGIASGGGGLHCATREVPA
ncbi:agmatine deiminase family protein [Burkholderia sp. F1]|uniref:agmatine deiminase family protein n=1 Tax=Burkholderia sp. F1 TaxID=3366817 RepID=UPI003D739FF1